MKDSFIKMYKMGRASRSIKIPISMSENFETTPNLEEEFISFKNEVIISAIFYKTKETNLELFLIEI